MCMEKTETGKMLVILLTGLKTGPSFSLLALPQYSLLRQEFLDMRTQHLI